MVGNIRLDIVARGDSLAALLLLVFLYLLLFLVPLQVDVEGSLLLLVNLLLVEVSISHIVELCLIKVFLL